MIWGTLGKKWRWGRCGWRTGGGRCFWVMGVAAEGYWVGLSVGRVPQHGADELGGNVEGGASGEGGERERWGGLREVCEVREDFGQFGLGVGKLLAGLLYEVWWRLSGVGFVGEAAIEGSDQFGEFVAAFGEA